MQRSGTPDLDTRPDVLVKTVPLSVVLSVALRVGGHSMGMRMSPCERSMRVTPTWVCRCRDETSADWLSSMRVLCLSCTTNGCEHMVKAIQDKYDI